MTFLAAAIMGPIFGFIIDKTGGRVLFMILCSLLCMTAYLTSMFVPGCDQCYYELGPLIISGTVLALYQIVLFSSIPYLVEDH